MLKQIIIISDGKSDIGPNPVNMAALASDNSIVVNTIGIIDREENPIAIYELKNIAERGGGICELSNINNLSQVLSKLTAESLYSTVEEMVGQEFKEILDFDIEQIEPRERNKYIKLINRIGNEIDLRCLILLDISGSLKDKIDKAKKSIFELLLFLEDRMGENHIGVMVFPYENNNCKLLCDFTQDIDTLKKGIKTIKAGSTTPTGSAIEKAMEIFLEDKKYPIYDNII